VEKPKLAVIWPWFSPFTFTGFTESMLALEHPEGWDVKFIRGHGWCSARRHIDGCEKACAWGADLLLIVGSDQTYPEDMLSRLVTRFQEGYEVVAALVPSRGSVPWVPMRPFQPMAYRFKPNGNVPRQYRGFVLDGDMIEIVEPKLDVPMERIDFCGSGVLMFHRDHLLALDKPWFSEHCDPETYERIANMDSRFVWRLKCEAGAQVWLDTTIKVRHLHVMPIDETFQYRFEDWRNDEVPPNYDPSQYRPLGVESIQK
jgi:hypothetical protein